MLEQVDIDHIAIGECRNRTSCCRLWRDMAYTGTACAARESPIGNECHLFTKAHAHNIGSGSQHFLHPWPTTRPLVANNDHITGLYRAIENARASFLLRIKDACGTTMPHHGKGHSGNFDDRAIGSEVAKEDGKPSTLTVRFIDRQNDLWIFDLRVGDILSQRFERHGGTVEIERTRLSRKFFEYGTDAACSINILHMPLS